MRRFYWIICTLLLFTLFSPGARADSVNGNLYFYPKGTYASSFLFVGYKLDGFPEGVGVVSLTDLFTMSGNVMTFIPGVYDPHGNRLVISASNVPGTDNFSVDGLSFTLPSSVTPVPGYDVGRLYLTVENVAITLPTVPEPGTLLLLGAGLPFFLIKRR